MPLNATQRTPGRLRPFHVLLVQMAVDALGDRSGFGEYL